MKSILNLLTISICCMGFFAAGTYDEKQDAKLETMTNQDTIKIKMTVNGKNATGVIYDNATGRDFLKLFPLSVVLEDYNETEKIVELKQSLSVDDAPSGFTPHEGDIAYYEPWGNIAVFYKSFSYSNGLISLGRVTEGLEQFKVKGSLKITFETDKK